MLVDLDRTGYTNFDVNGRKFYLEIIDSVNDYVALMKKIFDFKLLKEYLSSGEVNVIANGMNGGEKLYYLLSLNLLYLRYCGRIWKVLKYVWSFFNIMHERVNLC